MLFDGPCFGHAKNKVGQNVANYDKTNGGLALIVMKSTNTSLECDMA
jgi:hypothetical protein